MHASVPSVVPQRTDSVVQSSIDICKFHTVMVKVSLVLLVPYAYVDGEAEKNEAVSNFINLFKASAHMLQDEQELSVHVILQPNLQWFQNHDVFNLNKKTKGVWVNLAMVKQVQPASDDINFGYEVLQVYPAGKGVVVSGQKLRKKTYLGWKGRPTSYKFTQERNLYKILNDGGLSEPWARCIERESNGIDYRYTWKVLEVFPAGENQYVGANEIKLGCARVLGDEKLEIKWVRPPRKFVFYSTQIVDGKKTKTVEKINQEEKKKWETPLAGLVTVLPLLRWHKRGDTVQYGFFRNTLLHHETTITKLKELSGPGNIVYAHIFDPDVVSLHVKVAAETKFLFSVYADEIIAQKNDENELPVILSSSYCFKTSDENAVINKLFKLNSKFNEELHTRLPGAGYFSECNTLLRYIDEEYWKKLKFGRDRNEIMPIVKHLLREGKQMKYIEGAMQTSVPARMKKWQNSNQNYGDQGNQNYNCDFFLYLENCSQVLLKPFNWGRRVNSPISSCTENYDKHLKKHLSALWKFYSPTRRYQEAQVKYESFQAFIDHGYDEELETNVEELNNILQRLRKYSLTGKYGWEKVSEAAERCGEVYKEHIASWNANADTDTVI